MRVLIGCEESGYIRSEFIRQGHDAWSCDLLPAADMGRQHIKKDVLRVLETDHGWDLVICHPPCTALAVSGNRYYAGTRERDEAQNWTENLWQLATRYCRHVCFEQPVSVLALPGADKQTLHPWQFRLAEAKTTILHTVGLPPLKTWVTEKPAIVHEVVWKMGPSEHRSRERGYLPWLARPMAEQWDSLEISN